MCRERDYIDNLKIFVRGILIFSIVSIGCIGKINCVMKFEYVRVYVILNYKFRGLLRIVLILFVGIRLEFLVFRDRDYLSDGF